MPEVAEGVNILDDDSRHKLWRQIEELAREEAAGFVIEGENPANYFKGEWQPDLASWPADAGVYVGEGDNRKYIKDSIEAEVVAGTFVVAKPSKKTSRVRAATLRKVELDGANIRAVRENMNMKNVREWSGYPDPFLYGANQAVPGVGGINQQYLPLWPGPVTRQLYWQDYWMMSAKAFEAYNHDPLSWRCVHLKSEFALGKGISYKIAYESGSKKGQIHDQATKVWGDFCKRNSWQERLKVIARDYCWGGEQFIRFFKKGPQLTVRSLDPATIYDLITDPEDIESVFAYHQQYQTAYQLYPPKSGTPPTGIAPPTGQSQPGSIVRYIIRQILPQEIDHYKANASSSERRGRSDLFPALGWIKRLRDYLTSHVIRADMLSRICWDLQVNGNQAAVQTLRNQLFPGGRPPQPGTIFGHNLATKLEAVAPPAQSSGGSRTGDPILDALVTMVSCSAGVPKDWLGFGIQNTRAGALVVTEPASKSLDDFQGVLETLNQRTFDRVMATALITNATMEVTFPSIASEDRKQKLDDLGTMEANDWLSKRTAGTLAGKEMGITTYDFETEQKLIADEFAAPDTQDHPDGLLGPDGQPVKVPKQGDGKIRRQVIIATKRQAPKLDITKSTSIEDDPQGLAVPSDGSVMPAPDSPDGTKRSIAGGGSHNNGVTRGGAPANENPNSAGGASNIRKDNTNVRESDLILEVTPSQLGELLREAMRRRPDDPDFLELAKTYHEETKANLDKLVASTQKDH